MFGFTPHASRLGSISSRAAQVQAMGQQPIGFQPPPTLAATQPPAAPATPGAPSAAQPPGQDPISQAYHWIAHQFGGGPAATVQPAASGTSTAMTPDTVNTAMANSGGSATVAKYLAGMFGM